MNKTARENKQQNAATNSIHAFILLLMKAQFNSNIWVLFSLMTNVPIRLKFYFCNNNRGLHFAGKWSVMITTQWGQMGIRLYYIQYCVYL